MSTTIITSTLIEIAALALGLALFIFIVQREAAAVAGLRLHLFTGHLLVVIAPLVVAFITIIIGHLRNITSSRSCAPSAL